MLSPSNKTPSSLNALELDALREAATIGAGHAATALSQLTRQTVRLRVPQVAITTPAELRNQLNLKGEPYVAVAMGLLGDVAGQTVQIYPHASIGRLSALLLDVEDADSSAEVEDLNELQQSTLTEVSNIIVGAYLDALSRFIPLLMFMSTPTIWVRDLGPVLGHAGSDELICFHTDLELGHEHFSATFLLMPTSESINTMLRALYVA